MKANNFVPDHLLLKMIALLDKCKCDLCHNEKKKREDMLAHDDQSKISEVTESKPPVKEDNMQGVNEIEYWRNKAHDYEYLFHEQQDISKGYREIIEELKKEMNSVKYENTKLNWAAGPCGHAFP